MIVAILGVLTELMKTLATGVGAGMLLGGFVGGSAAMARGASRHALEARVPRDGYLGGLAAVAVMIADIMFRYAL